MSFRKSLLILCAISLSVGAFFFVIGMKLNPPGGKSVYAALITSVDVPDRKVRELLSSGDNTQKKIRQDNWAAALISESSAWVLLDNFSEIEKVPLDQYEQRVFPTDPRNDGYAKRLRDFFTSGGKRLFFIPLHSVAGGNLEKQIAPLLGEIPFSIEPLSSTKPVKLFLIFFGVAVVFMILFRLLPANLRVTMGDYFFCLPVLISLAFFGAMGFVLAALLLALAVLLKEPLIDFFLQYRYRKSSGFSPPIIDQLKKYFITSIRGPHKINWIITFAIIAFYIAFAVIARDVLALAAGTFFVFAVVFVFSVSTFSLRGDSQGHIRFSPVLITKSAFNWRFLVVMLPFALAALASGISDSFVPSSNVSASPFVTTLRENLVAEDEYLAHAAFQASFSNRSLAQDKEYRTYVQADDGLIDMDASQAAIQQAAIPQASIPQVVIPPYPLRDLMRFLAPKGGASKGVSQKGQDKE